MTAILKLDCQELLPLALSSALPLITTSTYSGITVEPMQPRRSNPHDMRLYTTLARLKWRSTWRAFPVGQEGTLAHAEWVWARLEEHAASPPFPIELSFSRLTFR